MFYDRDESEGAWSDVAWACWHVLTARSDGVPWSEVELSRALNLDLGQVMDGVNELILSGHVRAYYSPSSLMCMGWCRA